MSWFGQHVRKQGDSRRRARSLTVAARIFSHLPVHKEFERTTL